MSECDCFWINLSQKIVLLCDVLSAVSHDNGSFRKISQLFNQIVSWGVELRSRFMISVSSSML